MARGHFHPRTGAIASVFGANFISLVSFAATAFAIGLAAAIYRNQALQAFSDNDRHRTVLEQIKGKTSAAADSAGSAHANTAEILKLLNDAQRNRTGTGLDARRESAVSASLLLPVPKQAGPVLWVDDDAGSIEMERAALGEAGVGTVWVDNTSRALELLDGNEFGVVITDMGRIEGPREGYVLLDAMRSRGDHTPVIVYSGSDRPEHRQEANDHGGQGATNDPSELFQLVMSQLSRGRR